MTEPTADTSAARAWQVVTLGALVVVAEGYDLIVFGALLPKLLAEPGWGLTKASAGSIGSLVYLGMLVGALAGGPICDRVGRRSFVNVSVAWFTVWTVACALTQTPWQLGAARLLAGLGMGAVIPAAVALAKEYAPGHRTGLVVTILMAGIPIGGTAASLLGIALLPSHGWRIMFLVGGGISLVVLVLSPVRLPESAGYAAVLDEHARPPRPSAISAFPALFREHRALLTTLFAIATFANLLTWYGLNTWLTTLMREMNYPLGSALTFSLCLNTGAVVGSLVLVLAADRWGLRQVAAVCGVLTAAGILICAAGPQHTGTLLATVTVIGAAAQTALTLILASVADSYPTRIRASAVGWANGTGRAGAVVAPALGGAILAAGLGPRAVLLTFAGSALAAAATMVVLAAQGPPGAVGARGARGDRPARRGGPIVSSPAAGVVQAHRALAAAGQGDLVWAHASLRDPDGRGVWTKASSWGFEEITEERVLLVSPEGDVLAGTGSRHIEFPIHTEVLRARPDAGAVVHTHPRAAVAFAALAVPLRALDHDGVLFSEPDVPRFAGTGGLIRTAELGAAVAETLGNAPAVLLPRHGIVAVGSGVAEAVMHAVLLDRACRTQLAAMAAGELRGWSDAAECAVKRAECWNPTQIDAGWQYLLRAAGLHS